MTNQEQTSGGHQGTATGQGQPRSDEDISPPDTIRGESAASRQKGQPGLPDSDKQEWSPGSDAEK
jgi:hypothetical protein